MPKTDSFKRFTIAHYPGTNVCLKVTGGYATAEEKQVIRNAGWKEAINTNTMPKLPEDVLAKTPHVETEIYHPRIGSGLAGRHTPNESRAAKHALRVAFKKAGIPLYSHKGDPLKVVVKV